MASLKERLGDRVTYHYHEYTQPDTAKVNRDFAIRSHPVVVILNRKGRLIQRFTVAGLEEIEAALRPLL